MLKKIDYFLLLPASLLTLLGSVILSSIAPASYPEHFIYIALAILIFIFFSRTDIEVLRRFTWPAYITSVVLLVVTLLIGTTSRGATRWITLGGASIQTSEIVKPLLILFYAEFLGGRQSVLKYFQLAVLAVIPIVLVFLQPDLGSAIVLTFGFIGAVILAGLPFKLIFSALAIVAAAIPVSLKFLHGYQKERIDAFFNPGQDPLGIGYNSAQAMIAIGSGAFFGRGLGQGTQSQLYFLPERHTDFIFSALSEELGFLGAGLVIASFTVIFLRLAFLATKTDSIFVRTIVGAVFFTIFIQAAVNISMNLGVLPVTGIPLPFVSSGGSSLLAMSALLGIMSSVSFSLKERSFSGII